MTDLITQRDRATTALETWGRSLSLNTRTSYATAWAHFSRFIGADNAPNAILELARLTPGEANAKVMEWRASMIAANAMTNSINLRLSAVRSLVRMAKSMGLIEFNLEVPGVKTNGGHRRAHRAPTVDQMVQLLKTADNARDKAIIMTMYTMCLRRAEIISLDLVHFEGDILMVKRKGYEEREAILLPDSTREVIEVWLEVRGNDDGPLFWTATQKRMRGSHLYRMIKRLGKRIGMELLSPHNLRHASVTHALNLSGGNVRDVRLLAGHASVKTTMRYDDERQHPGLGLSKMLEDQLVSATLDTAGETTVNS